MIGLVNTPKTTVLPLKRTTTQQVEIVWSAPRPTWRALRPPGTNCTIVSEPLGRLMSRTEHMCDVTMQGRHVGSGDSEGMLCMKPTSSMTTSFRRFVWNSTRQSDVKMSNSRLLSVSFIVYRYSWSDFCSVTCRNVGQLLPFQPTLWWQCLSLGRLVDQAVKMFVHWTKG